SFFFSSRRRHTRSKRDWSSDVCSSDLRHARVGDAAVLVARGERRGGKCEESEVGHGAKPPESGGCDRRAREVTLGSGETDAPPDRYERLLIFVSRRSDVGVMIGDEIFTPRPPPALPNPFPRGSCSPPHPS